MRFDVAKVLKMLMPKSPVATGIELYTLLKDTLNHNDGEVLRVAINRGPMELISVVLTERVFRLGRQAGWKTTGDIVWSEVVPAPLSSLPFVSGLGDNCPKDIPLELGGGGSAKILAFMSKMIEENINTETINKLISNQQGTTSEESTSADSPFGV